MRRAWQVWLIKCLIQSFMSLSTTKMLWLMKTCINDVFCHDYVVCNFKIRLCDSSSWTKTNGIICHRFPNFRTLCSAEWIASPISVSRSSVWQGFYVVTCLGHAYNHIHFFFLVVVVTVTMQSEHQLTPLSIKCHSEIETQCMVNLTKQWYTTYRALSKKKRPKCRTFHDGCESHTNCAAWIELN